jgi:hypothetical protein
MKERLKILFGLLRPFKEDRFDTYIDFIYDDIEQWDETFYSSKRQRDVTIPKIIVDTLEKIVKKMIPRFHRYNDYDIDDYWMLKVKIYPNENRINFTSECKFLSEQPYQYDIDLSSPKDKSWKPGDKRTLPQQILDEINDVFYSEMPEETESVEYTFDAKWGEIYIRDFEEDGLSSSTRLGPWQQLLDKIMKELIDRYWSEEGGMAGTITIEKDKRILIDCEFRNEDYEYTDMDINITPDSF